MRAKVETNPVTQPVESGSEPMVAYGSHQAASIERVLVRSLVRSTDNSQVN